MSDPDSTLTGDGRAATPAAARSADQPPLPDAAESVELAHRIIEHHLGSRAHALSPETGGVSNVVFGAEHESGRFIVRLCPDQNRIRAYEKERWVIERAREAGIPTPEVIDVGEGVVPCAYMLMHRVEGREALTHERRSDILRALGAYAERINAIPTTGFGDVFDWAPAGEPRHPSWRAFLAEELELERKLETLARFDMLPGPHLAGIRETLEALGDVPRTTSLNHGDLRLKNVMVDDDGEIVAILDWEKCVSGLAPEWELSLALHDLSVDEKDDFTQGYRLTPQDLERHAPVLKALNIVNYAPFIERAGEANDEEQVSRFRVRLSGALDLYSI